MAELRYHFENEIKLKISQKAKSNLSDETALAKYFRYFDLNNSGTVSAEEFQKTLIKIGITSVDNEGMFRLFDYYDTNRNGELDYREFANAIYHGNPPTPQYSQRSSPERPTTSQLRNSDNQIDEILTNIKRQLRGQGIGGMIGLAKALRLADKYQDKKLEFNEFSDVLRDCHIDLTNRQIERIFASLNKSGTELISYEDFLATLKGRLSTNKKAVITQAFHRLDNDRDGHVNIEEIRNLYNVQHHPDVTRGNRNENEVYREFNNAFDGYLAYKRIRNASLSSDEFEDLFAFIGSSYEDEHHFCTIMNQVWGLNKPQDYSDYKPWAQRTPAQSHRSEEIKRTETFAPPIEELEENLTHIFSRFRSRMTFKGVRGYLGIFKLFKNVDYDDDGVISKQEFLRILRDFKMEIPEQDLMYVWAHFDSRKQGQISYEDFMLNVLGSLNYERRHIVDQAWRKLDVGMAGRVQLSHIKGFFKDLRNHPDVKSGRKYQEQVISDLSDLLEFHHNVIERAPSSFVSKAEFENFLLYTSANTEDDKHFEAIVQSVFKLETEKNYQDSYAGQAAGRKGYDPTKGYLNDFHRSSQHGGSVSQNAPFGTDTGRPVSSQTSFRDDISERSTQSYTSQQPQYNNNTQQRQYTSQYNNPYTSQYNNPHSQQYNNVPSYSSQYNQPYTTGTQYNYGGSQSQSQSQSYSQQQQQTAPSSNQYQRPYTTQYSRQNNPPVSTSEIPSQRTSYSEKEFHKEQPQPTGASGLEEIKRKIRSRGIRGILGVIKSLRLLDSDKLKTLPVNSFVKALNDYRLDVDENKFKDTLEQNDLVKQGRVDYEAFLNLIKGDLNQRRKAAVQDAYERINEDKKGYVTADDIKTIYDARGHPDVKAHKREEDDVSMEFLETFDLQHMLSGKGKDKRVTVEEFVSYYEIVNCVIDDDKQFETMLTNCFRVYPSASKSDVSETSSRPKTKAFVGRF